MASRSGRYRRPRLAAGGSSPAGSGSRSASGSDVRRALRLPTGGSGGAGSSTGGSAPVLRPNPRRSPRWRRPERGVGVGVGVAPARRSVRATGRWVPRTLAAPAGCGARRRRGARRLCRPLTAVASDAFVCRAARGWARPARLVAPAAESPRRGPRWRPGRASWIPRRVAGRPGRGAPAERPTEPPRAPDPASAVARRRDPRRRRPAAAERPGHRAQRRESARLVCDEEQDERREPAAAVRPEQREGRACGSARAGSSPAESAEPQVVATSLSALVAHCTDRSAPEPPSR